MGYAARLCLTPSQANAVYLGGIRLVWVDRMGVARSPARTNQPGNTWVRTDGAVLLFLKCHGQTRQVRKSDRARIIVSCSRMGLGTNQARAGCVSKIGGVTKILYKGLLLGLLPSGIVSTLGAKLLYDRRHRPRV